MNNKINLPLDFDDEIYYKLHQDVYEIYKNNNIFTASYHYIHVGFFENRKYKVSLPEDFDEELYYKLYPDVKQEYLVNNDFTASYHYLNNGYYENRQYKVLLPEDFDEELYYKLHADVKEEYLLNSAFTAIFHYLNIGYFENRHYKVTLPEDFDEEIYYKLNPDVKEQNLLNSAFTAIFHYLNIGYFENRNYKVTLPEDFNEEIYYILNHDVKCQFLLNNEKSAELHYTSIGFFENRKYKLEMPDINIDLYIKNNIHSLNKNLIFQPKVVTNLKKENNTTLSILNFNNKKLVNIFDFDKDLINIDFKNILLQNKLFILIIDFPNLGGGTNVFLNTILNKYKNNTTFLIARNFNGIIKFTVNDDYLINKLFNIEESILFIDSIQNNIKKIFINHLLDHSIDFLNKIFNLKKEISIITHDYYFINNVNSQPYYEEIIGKKSFIDMSIFNKIISQNEINIDIISNNLSVNQEIVISSLPDFTTSLNYIQTNNTNIIIGIIGSISGIKGVNIIDNLLDYINIHNLNIEVIIFGKISCKYEYNNSYSFETINELNELLVKHKPNLLLETSIWPETYSYTLTLSMITQLPILSLKKPFHSVIQNRLSTYSKVNYFSTLKELIDLIPCVKQDYLYTIDPTISYNFFWEKYFNINDENLGNTEKNINIENKNLVLITSKIFVSNTPYSYSKTRSTYTPEERMKQTLETITSVKIHIPDAFIVLVDNSNFDESSDFYHLIKEKVDIFINSYNNDELKFYTDEYIYKAFADISQQIDFYNKFLKYIEVDKIKNFFKISGRYYINQNFNYSIYNNKKNIFKKNKNVKDRNYYYTCFYKLDKNILHEYFNNLFNLRNNKEKYENHFSDIEVIVPHTIIDKITLVDTLGITQRIAVHNNEDEI